jgi:glycosyltransferase involved in cell wall biosynthesis
VFIPVYEGSRWLPGAIESVLGQSHADFELIVGDNASSEDIEALLPRDPRIRYQRWADHVDIFDNFNRTLDMCRAEWTFLLPVDDRLLPGCLSRLAEVVGREPDRPRPLALVMPAAVRIDAEGHRVDHRYYGFEGIRVVRPGRYDAAGWIEAVCSSGSAPWDGGAYRRSIIEAMGSFYRTDVPDMSGDLELSLRVAAYGDVVYLDEPLMAVTSWPESHTHGRVARNLASGDPHTFQGVALVEGYRAHLQRGTASARSRRLVRAAVARSLLRRAAAHRYLAAGRGHRGATLDVARALRVSPTTVVPRQLPRTLALMIAPRWLLRLARESVIDRRAGALGDR